MNKSSKHTDGSNLSGKNIDDSMNRAMHSVGNYYSEEAVKQAQLQTIQNIREAYINKNQANAYIDVLVPDLFPIKDLEDILQAEQQRIESE